MTTDSEPRIVLDTNVIVSGISFKGQNIRRLLLRALDEYQVVFSQATWDELSSVMQRDVFERHMPLGARLRALAELACVVEVLPSTSVVTDCRAPKDTKFLALALDAGARAIVTGDQNLKALHPYRGIAVLSPAKFMEGYP